MLFLVRGGQASGSPLITKNGERVFGYMTNAGLFEPRHGPGHWAGHSRGVSVPIGDTGMGLRVGQSRGHYVQGNEVPTIIDRGTATITNQRVVFQGAKRTQEWAFAKLSGFQHDTKHSQTSFNVSNRQKVSGLSYGSAADFFRTRFALALAVFEGDTTSAVAELEAALQAVNDRLESLEGRGQSSGLAREAHAVEGIPAASPAEIPAGADPADAQPQSIPATLAEPLPDRLQPTVAPGWYPDPAKRFVHRWWDGSAWTGRVGDGRQELSDPL